MTKNEAPTFGVRFGFFLVLSIYIGALTSLLAAVLSIMLFGLPEDALSGAVLMVLVVVVISMVPVFIVSVILGLMMAFWLQRASPQKSYWDWQWCLQLGQSVVGLLFIAVVTVVEPALFYLSLLALLHAGIGAYIYQRLLPRHLGYWYHELDR